VESFDRHAWTYFPHVDGPESEDILRPLFMGCATRNAKIVIMCLGSLHRLITLKLVPVSSVQIVISTLSDCISQGVDVQLRILQILLSLLTNYPSTHGNLLGDVRVSYSQSIVSSLTAIVIGFTALFQAPRFEDCCSVIHGFRNAPSTGDARL
jgi:hypothetical protein